MRRDTDYPHNRLAVGPHSSRLPALLDLAARGDCAQRGAVRDVGGPNAGRAAGGAGAGVRGAGRGALQPGPGAHDRSQRLAAER